MFHLEQMISLLPHVVIFFFSADQQDNWMLSQAQYISQQILKELFAKDFQLCPLEGQSCLLGIISYMPLKQEAWLPEF